MPIVDTAGADVSPLMSDPSEDFRRGLAMFAATRSADGRVTV